MMNVIAALDVIPAQAGIGQAVILA